MLSMHYTVCENPTYFSNTGTGVIPNNPTSVKIKYKLIERNSMLQFICDFTPNAGQNIKYYVFWYKDKKEVKVYADIIKPEFAAIDNILIGKAGSQVFEVFLL